MDERDLLAQALTMWLSLRRADYHALSDASASDGLPQETRDVAKRLAAELLHNINRAERMLTQIEAGEQIP